MQQTPYQILGGEPGVRQLADAFYDAMDRLETASDVRAMHKENLGEVKQKLFEFLSGWLGGPGLYSKKYGTICLTEPHQPFKIGSNERDQWLVCMTQALDDIGASGELKDLLRQPMYMVADMVRNQD